jgi:hypothetical protein
VQAGAIALHKSAEKGYVDAARLLLESTADIHTADKVP